MAADLKVGHRTQSVTEFLKCFTFVSCDTVKSVLFCTECHHNPLLPKSLTLFPNPTQIVKVLNSFTTQKAEKRDECLKSTAKLCLL